MVASCFLSIQPKTSPSTNDTEEPLVRFAVAPEPSVGPGFPTPQVQSQVDWMQLLWEHPRRRVGSPVPCPQGRTRGHLLELMVCTAPGSQPPRTAPSGSGKKATGDFPRVSALELGRGHAPVMQLPSQEQATHTHGGPPSGGTSQFPTAPHVLVPPQGCLFFYQRGVMRRVPGSEVRSQEARRRGKFCPGRGRGCFHYPGEGSRGTPRSAGSQRAMTSPSPRPMRCSQPTMSAFWVHCP